MSARNRELLALVPVAALVTAGFAAVFAVQGHDVSDVSITYGGYFLAVCLVTHLLIRIRLPNADPFLFPLVALLAAFGLVMLFRIDEGLALRQASVFLLGLGVFAATIIFLRDYHVLERYRYLIASIGIGLLLLPRVPGIGQQVNGAFLAIDIGPLAFQPAEFAKLCLVIFLASYLREHREVLVVGARRIAGITLPPLKHFGPVLIVWGASMLMLVFIRDLGSSLMFFGAFLALLYVATNRLSFVVIGLGMFLLGAWFFSATVPHVSDRVDIWLDPFADPDGDGRSNLLEYAIGGNPQAFDQTGSPVLISNGDALSLQFVADTGKTDLVYQAQLSTDLVNWTDTAAAVTGTFNSLEIREAALPANAIGFARLKVTRTSP